MTRSPVKNRKKGTSESDASKLVERSLSTNENQEWHRQAAQKVERSNKRFAAMREVDPKRMNEPFTI